MYRFFLHATAHDIVDVVDGQERAGVFFFDDGFQLGDLQTSNDRVEDSFRLVRVRAFAVEYRNTTTESCQKCLGKIVRSVRYDHDAFRLFETGDDEVHDFVRDEVRDERVHRTLPTEYETCTRQDEEVDDHDRFTDRQFRFAVRDDSTLRT